MHPLNDFDPLIEPSHVLCLLNIFYNVYSPQSPHLFPQTSHLFASTPLPRKGSSQPRRETYLLCLSLTLPRRKSSHTRCETTQPCLSLTLPRNKRELPSKKTLFSHFKYCVFFQK